MTTATSIEYRIGRYLLTNRTAGARYGIPVLHDTTTGREYGPGDVLPFPPHLANIPGRAAPGTAAELVRGWRDITRGNPSLATCSTEEGAGRYTDEPGVRLQSARTAEEIAAADLYLSQLG
jgi:hypothetical protein